MDNQRIKILDGFRAIAVLGVLWAHIWMFYANPGFVLFHVNIAQPISFLGNGVDLFFVISGFCMYLMYTSRSKSDITWPWVRGYLKKRWFRIAPAFYVAIIVYGLVAVGFSVTNFDWVYALKNFLFVRNFFDEGTQYAPHFWSLYTEWQFYLLLPFLLILINKYPFTRVISGIVIVSLAFRFIAAVLLSPDNFNLVSFSLPCRLIEFVMGIIVAHIFLSGKKTAGNWGVFILGLGVAIAGRILLSANFHNRADWIGICSKAFDIFLLSGGYAIVILSALSFRSGIAKFLEFPLLTSIGKYSYSMYLWHWLIAEWLTMLVKSKIDAHPFLLVNFTFVLSVVLLVPVSALSYKLFEAPYFRRRQAPLAEGN